MLGPYPVADVITQLENVTALRVVGGVGDFEAAQQQPPRTTPAAYVLSEESGRKLDDYSSARRQHLAVVIKVVLWVRHAGSAATGAKAAAAMSALEAQVRTALLGFTPTTTDGQFSPLWIRNSGGDQYFGNHLIHQVLFESDYVIEDRT